MQLPVSIAQVSWKKANKKQGMPCASVFIFCWSALFMQLMYDSHLHTPPSVSCGVWNHSQWFGLMFTRLYNRRLPWGWVDLKSQGNLLIRGLPLSTLVSPLVSLFLSHLFFRVFSVLEKRCFVGVMFRLCFAFTHTLAYTGQSPFWRESSLDSKIDDRVWGSWQYRTTALQCVHKTHNTVTLLPNYQSKENIGIWQLCK